MRINRFELRRPYRFVLLLELVVIAVLVLTGVVTKRLGRSDFTLYGGSLSILSLVGIVIVHRMGWWRHIGFRRLERVHWKLLWLLLVPVLVQLVKLVYKGGMRSVPMGMNMTILAITLFGGFMEEVFFRGLMLRAIAPRGLWRAAFLSSLLFGATHMLNAAAGWSLVKVLWQLCYSFALGFGWAGFAVRTGTIWPLVTIHFLINYFGLFTSSSIVQTGRTSTFGMMLSITYSVAFLAYGIVLIRSAVQLSGNGALQDGYMSRENSMHPTAD